MRGEQIVLKRDCEAVQIPSGDPVYLYEGAEVTITQSLGDSFTVLTENGYMVRIAGKDADALGKEVHRAHAPDAAPLSGEELDQAAWDAMRTCYDPEIPVNIVELGLVYSCKIKELESGGHRIDAVITLTAPGCGMGPVLQNDVRTKLLELPGVEEVWVDVTFEPQWDQSMMSEAARLQLGM